MNYKVIFEFFKYLNHNKKVMVREHIIEGNSVMECSRKAFEFKRKIESEIGGEILYKKKKVIKKKPTIKKSDDEGDSIKSKDLTAKNAIDHISSNDDIEEFLSIDEDRTTVINAYNKKINEVNDNENL